MKFNDWSKLKNEHAFLGASRYHWTNYTEEKLINTYKSYRAKLIGTEIHELAETLIRLRVKLPQAPIALNMFVNDAIGFRMTPEQPLFYSLNAFGTADAISYRSNELRIHDLKTGVTKVSVRQLEVYAALFCLEYSVRPNTLNLLELRIYQGEEIIVHIPEPEVIEEIMEIIVKFDDIINKMQTEME